MVLSRLARALWIEVGKCLKDSTAISKSRLARALWIEVVVGILIFHFEMGRGSREPCGSKSLNVNLVVIITQSRLARALWIEVASDFLSCLLVSRRGSREPCGSKSFTLYVQGSFLEVEARESLVDRSNYVRIV